MNSYTEIYRQCLQRNPKAQLKFYTLFYKGVYNSCYRILGESQEAEEVMQEAFLKVFERMEEYSDGQEGMARMLKRIAINRSIDLLRKRKVLFTELKEEDGYPEEECNEEEEEVQLSMIREKLKELPQGYRIVFTLHLIEEMDYEDIALQLQISTSAVRSQFARAKEKLQQMIRKEYCYESR